MVLDGVMDSIRTLIDLLVLVRRKLRLKKDFETADFIRDKLAELGLHVVDTERADDLTGSYNQND